MKLKAPFSPLGPPRPRGWMFLVALAAAGASACSSGEMELPDPRPVVIRSGERLFADPDRMKTVDTWFRAQQEIIRDDPSFLIARVNRDTPSYPWESLVLSGDTATFGIQGGYDDAAEVFEIYAFYRLMDRLGRLGDFLPGGDNLEGFQLERAMVSRVADAWFLGRAVYQAEAFDPLEEILYANEFGFLDALILTARADEFPEEREAWLEEDPEAQDRYRSWFLDTFSREPPGLRGGR